MFRRKLALGKNNHSNETKEYEKDWRKHMNKIKIGVVIFWIMGSLAGSINVSAGQTGGQMYMQSASSWSYSKKFEKTNGNDYSDIILHSSYSGNSSAYVATYAYSSSGNAFTTYKKRNIAKNSIQYRLSSAYDLFPEQTVWLGMMSTNSTDTAVYTWNYQ